MNSDLRPASWRRWRLPVLGLCLVAAFPVGAEETQTKPTPEKPLVISAIEFVGNKVTRARILRQEMVVKEGDVADPVKIEISRQGIMDLGLFSSVRAILIPNAEGVLLRMEVKEKYYILPVPKLNHEDYNHISLGAEISFDNLAGLNQKLKLRYENEDSTTVPGAKVNSNLLSYSYPRVYGGPWTLNTEISEAKTQAEDNRGPTLRIYDLSAWTASASASRWLNDSGPSHGWQLGVGMVWRRNDYGSQSCIQTDPYRDAQAVGLTGSAQFIDVRDLLYSRSGEEYGYNVELGSRALGSDTHYTRHEFFYRHYFTFDNRLHENVDLQLRLGLSSGDIFPSDTYAYTLGGSKSLRGYETASLTGNSYVQLNVQYLRPFFNYYPFRGALFFDIGNAYPSNTELHLLDLKWDVGIGFRLRLKSFVKIDLRVDAAYAYDTGEWRYFAGTKEMF